MRVLLQLSVDTPLLRTFSAINCIAGTVWLCTFFNYVELPARRILRRSRRSTAPETRQGEIPRSQV